MTNLKAEIMRHFMVIMQSAAFILGIDFKVIADSDIFVLIDSNQDPLLTFNPTQTSRLDADPANTFHAVQCTITTPVFPCVLEYSNTNCKQSGYYDIS